MRPVIFVFGLIVVSLLAGGPHPARAENVFNALSLARMELEQKHGLTTLECFPFLEQIGTRTDEIQRVQQCLTGVRTLSRALLEVPDAGLRIAGISTRFLRSGGFQALLVRWDATREEMVRALRDKPSPEKQQQFLAQISGLKQNILSGLRIRQLYCTFKISNEQCLQGYQTLASVEPGRSMSRMSWVSVAITDTHVPENDRTILTLKHDDTPETMSRRLQNDPAAEEWRRKKTIYNEIQKRYGETFKALQLPNFFCDRALEKDQCLQGAENFNQAARSPSFKTKLWGTVVVHRYNTLIQSDHDAMMRYDLPPGQIVQAFSLKPDHTHVQVSVTLAEKLEKRTRNNSTGLRAVCDLEGLLSADCVRGLKTFIEFIKSHREYRVAQPFTDLMFIDSGQLWRVNFALNSKVRDTYIYIDVHSTPEEMAARLSHFQQPEPIR